MCIFDNLNTSSVLLFKIKYFVNIENDCVIRVQCSVRFVLSVV